MGPGLLAILLALIGAAPVVPPPAAPPAEVTVTAARPLILTVDFNKVWTRCAACVKQRTRLHALAAPMLARNAPVRSSVMGYAPGLQEMQDHAGRAYQQTIEHARGDRQRSQSIVGQALVPTRQAAEAARRRMETDAQQFLDRLGARVSGLAETRRIALRASGVQRPNTPVAPGTRTLDITRWIIAEVDRDPSGLLGPAGSIAPAQPAR